MAIARQRMTLDEFLKFPEEEPPLELLFGEVTQKVSPKMYHSATQTRLIVRFEVFCTPRKLGRAFSELRTSYEGMSTVPDVVYFVQARLPRAADGRRLTEALIPPGYRHRDRLARSERYRSGSSLPLVRRQWRPGCHLDRPDRLSVILFRPGVEPIALRDTGSLDLGDVIPGFVLDVADLFSALNVD